MSENPKHFRSDEPCKKCGGRERYVSTHNCVPCLKAKVKARRAQLAATAALFQAAYLDDGSDLL